MCETVMPTPKQNCLIKPLSCGYNVWASNAHRLAICGIDGVEMFSNFGGDFDHCHIEISPRYDVGEVLEAIRQVCEGG